MSKHDWTDARASRFRNSATVGTAFHSRGAQYSGRSMYFNWDLYHVVDEYDDFIEELKAIRETAAFADMSPLTKLKVSGPEAFKFIDYVTPRDTTKLGVQQVFWTSFCNEEGKVINDGLVFRLDETTYRTTTDPLYNWFSHYSQEFDIELEEETDDFGILSLQGPRATEVLNVVTGQDWSDLSFSRLEFTEISGVKVELARQGFTGEVGYELLVATEDGGALWDAFMDVAEQFDLIPAGENVLGIARVEAGLMIPGPDYTNAYVGLDPTGSHTIAAAEPEYVSSPFELGMGSFVDLDAGEFIGRDALLEEQAKGGPPRRAQGIEIDWREIVDLYVAQGISPTIASRRVQWDPLRVYDGDQRIGRASSVVWSPTVKKMVGFGHVLKEYAEVGTEVSVEWEIEGGESGKVGAKIVKLPHVPHKRAS